MMQLIDQVNDKVRGYLKERFTDKFQEIEGRFLVPEGSAMIQVIVRPWKDDDVMVECLSYVVEDAQVNPELMRFLLRRNATIHFGAFGLLYDDTVIFSHSIAGANMNLNEFEASLRTVALIANHYDDEIIGMAGGKRAVDR